MKICKIIVVLTLILCLHPPVAIIAKADTVYVSVAASMTDVLKEIIETFAKSHPEIKILPNFASSGSLAKQIFQGAPADVYISANQKWMDYLIDQKVVDSSSRKTFAYNRLVFIGRPETIVASIQGIKSLNRIAIGNPRSVPAGTYAKQAMENAGVYDSVKNGNKLVMAKDVRQALIYTDRGEVDGAFVYKTDALLARRVKLFFEVEGKLYDKVSYPLCLTLGGVKKAEAILFYDFIISAEAVWVLEKYGFEQAK